MSLSSQKILQVKITTASKKLILEEIKKYLIQSVRVSSSGTSRKVRPFIITTPNPEQIVFAQSHSDFRNILNRADVALPDGIGLLLASRILSGKVLGAPGVQISQRVAGVDFMNELVTLAELQRVSIGLIGGYNGLAVKALDCLQASHPKLSGWAMDGPELVGEDFDSIQWPGDQYWVNLAKKIRETHTHIVFVGLGAPKQEYVTMRLSDKMNFPVIYMSVGGSFDVIAGRLRRAPIWIRSIGFEWFWRLLQEPWRWRRQRALLQFMVLMLKNIALSR